MPCDDVSEYLQLTLDGDGRIATFSLEKNTCGAPVGNALLLSYISGHAPDRLLGQSPTDLVPELEQSKRLDQFLLTKQLFALQEALAVYLGRKAGDKDATFAIETIEVDEQQTKISGLVRVDIIAENIEACRRCCAAPK